MKNKLLCIQDAEYILQQKEFFVNLLKGEEFYEKSIHFITGSNTYNGFIYWM